MASRRGILASAGVATVAAGGLAVALSTGGDDAARAADEGASPATTIIRRGDLVETESVDGTLGYAGERAVPAPSGTVTWTPDEGAIVRSGQRLYAVEGRAVFVVDGTTVAWRDLAPGTTGSDVRQLKRALRRGGYDREGERLGRSRSWTDATTAAVRRWQRARGLDDTGTIERGRIVFAPGDRRVATVDQPAGSVAPSASAGSSADAGTGASSSSGATGSGTLLTTTSTRRRVAIDLDASKQELAQRGARVGITLPDGREVGGRIASVASVAEKLATEADPDPPATVEVTVRLDRRLRSRLDQAPVDVELEEERADDVLVVPVTALLARDGGGFAVEVREGDQRRSVAVQTGVSTDAQIEVRGDGLRPGMRVTDARV